MRIRTLAVAIGTIAGVLAAPQAFAAQDANGMQYTSAAEGFYGSIRARFETGNKKDAGANVGNSSSRIGIRGTNDLGNGLEGFYQYELGVGIDNGSSTETRLGHVGLRGTFGEVAIGTSWGNDYNFVHGSTDVANVGSGNVYGKGDGGRAGRASRAIQYTSPDLSGFQAGLRAIINSDADASDGDTTKDSNDLDAWNMSAIYNIQGFTAAGSYNVIPDGYGSFVRLTATGTGGQVTTATPSKKEDISAWTARLGYSQDNWYVNGWYGVDNTSDAGAFVYIRNLNAAAEGTNPDTTDDGERVTLKLDDTEMFSIAAGVSIDRVELYAVYETLEKSGINSNSTTAAVTKTTVEDTYTTVGVTYMLGAQSRVWVEYAGRDLDSDASAEDYVNIGLRHDF